MFLFNLLFAGPEKINSTENGYLFLGSYQVLFDAKIFFFSHIESIEICHLLLVSTYPATLSYFIHASDMLLDI